MISRRIVVVFFAVLIVSLGGVLWPMRASDVIGKSAERCGSGVVVCSWGGRLDGSPAQSDYSAITGRDRLELIRSYADERTVACDKGMSVVEIQRRQRGIDVYWACAGDGRRFVVLSRYRDFASFGGDDYESRVSVFPSVRSYWNWCPLDGCPSDLDKLFNIDIDN